MSRKETVWGARHVTELEEIRKIVDYYRNVLNFEITQLEASAVLASKSHDAIWNSKKARDFILSMRGML
jgi:hypothetical protein